MDQQSAAKLVSALDAEIARRLSRKDAAQDAAWEKELAGDEIVLMARRMARDWDRQQKAPRPSVPMSLEDRECMLEETLDYARSLFSLAAAIDQDERRPEAEAAGTLRRTRPVILGGPRIRAAAPAGNDPIVVDVLAKSDGPGKAPRKSRTEIWREQQEAERAARQQMLPLRPAPPVLQQTELGWHRGSIVQFDQQAKSGVVRFSGAAGFTEAAFGPDVALRSGHVNFFPGETVDCRLLRRLDGAVIIETVKMASGPEGSAAADPERFQVPLGLGRYH